MIHIIRLEGNNVRIVHGKLVNELTVDWSIKEMSELKRLIGFAINFVDELPSLKKAKYKKLRIYEGANHLDIIDHNVGSLNLLTIEDHFVTRENLEPLLNEV